MKKRVFIIHGWDGNPQANWYPWLKNELKNKGFTVEIPSMPDTESPKMQTWIPHLKKMAGVVNENTFFVGHSIGCQAILRHIENLHGNKKIGGAVFVAGWFNLTNLEDKEAEEIAKPWIKTPIDLVKVKSHLLKSIAIFSDNDPYVALDNQNNFKHKLGSKIIIERDMFHFNEGHGITQLPIALKSVLEISNLEISKA